MFNSRNLGALIVDEKPHVKSWDEPQYSIQNLAIEESYGFGVLNEGQAIAVRARQRPGRRDIDATGARLSRPLALRYQTLIILEWALRIVRKGRHRRCSVLYLCPDGLGVGNA